MRVLRGLWKVLVGVKDALVLLFMLLFFGGIFAALSMSPNPRLPASGALLIALKGSIVEQPAEADPLGSLSGSTPATTEYRLRDVVRALDGAVGDGAVKAVVLDLDRFTGGGQAAVTTVGEAMDRVRRAGKPVLTFATGYSDDGYQLAAHASEVWLDPLGAVLLTGPGGSRLYYKGLLDKLGVTARVYKVGQFKSAVEPFIRADQSPAAREANQALADALWQSWTQDVSHARPKAQLAAYAAAPQDFAERAHGDMATAAKAAGLVDMLGDRTAFGKRVAVLAGASTDRKGDGYQALALDRWLSAHPEPATGDPIGVVTIAGDIVDGTAGPGSAAGDTISRLILKAVREGKIKALVVRVDSPGGSVLASEKIRSAILVAKQAGLPIVTSMGSLAASGGYWVSTPGTRIFAEPSTITGSIGVFGIIPTFEHALPKIGVSADGVRTTPLSGEPDVYKGTSPAFDRLVQLGVENIYARFTGLVAASRHLTPARVDEIGQGHVWAGGTARQLGLVDQFGGLDDAVAYAAKAAKLDPGHVHPVFIEREPNAFKSFLRDLLKNDRDGEGAGGDAWAGLALRPQATLAQAVADARRITTGPAMQARCLECPPVHVAPAPADALLGQLLLARLGL